MANAQDVIRTLDGKSIEAKILEINDDTIVYKEYNYQTGPTYRVNTNDLISIVLENGTEKIYRTVPTDITFPSSISIRRGDIYGDGTQLPDEWLPFILGKDNYSKYQSGKSLRRLSTPLFLGGAGATISGTVMIVTCALVAKEKNADIPPSLVKGAYGLAALGLTAFVTAIPIRIISNSKLNSVTDDYNHDYHGQITMGATPNGIGVQFTF